MKLRQLLDDLNKAYAVYTKNDKKLHWSDVSLYQAWNKARLVYLEELTKAGPDLIKRAETSKELREKVEQELKINLVCDATEQDPYMRGFNAACRMVLQYDL